jgi:hypothetical protein
MSEDRLEAVAAAVRRANMARLLKNPPPGFRVSDDGLSIVPVGDSAWPWYPFDPECRSYAKPQKDILKLVRTIIPDFDPKSSMTDWLMLGELIISTGRSVEEVRKYSYDQLFAFLETHKHLLRKHCLAGRDGEAQPATDHAVSTSPSSPSDGEMLTLESHLTANERLELLWNQKGGVGRTWLISVKSREDIAKRICCGLTQTKNAPFFKSTIGPARQNQKALAELARRERQRKAERRDRSDF